MTRIGNVATTRLWNKSETRLWTLVLFCGSLCAYAARVSLPICVVAVSAEYDWSKADAGAVLGSFFWGYASTQVLAGWLADRVGGARLLVFATTFWASITIASPALFELCRPELDDWSQNATQIEETGNGQTARAARPHAHSLALLITIRVLMGAAQGFHFPSTASLVSSRLLVPLPDPAKCHVKCFIGLMWAFVLHTLESRQIGVRPRSNGSNRVIKIHASASESKLRQLQNGDISRIFKSLESEMQRERLLSDGDDVNSEKAIKPTASASGTPMPWCKLLTHHAFWAAFVAHYCGANAFFTLFHWLPTYFEENYPGAKGWVFNVVPMTAVAVTSLASPYLATILIHRGVSTTRVRRLMEGGSLAGMCLALALVTQVHRYAAAVLAMVLAMAARGLHHAGVSVNPNDMAPGHTGAVFGVLNMAGAIPGFVGVWTAGHILQLTHGDWSYVFAATAAQCALGAVVYSTFGTGNQIV